MGHESTTSDGFAIGLLFVFCAIIFFWGRFISSQGKKSRMKATIESGSRDPKAKLQTLEQGHTIRVLIAIIAALLVFVFLSSCGQKRTYKVKRLDNNQYVVYDFVDYSPLKIGDTVDIYDQINIYEGPIFIRRQAVVIDTAK